jgi:hypothetical protein
LLGDDEFCFAPLEKEAAAKVFICDAVMQANRCDALIDFFAFVIKVEIPAL